MRGAMFGGQSPKRVDSSAFVGSGVRSAELQRLETGFAKYEYGCGI